MSLLLLQVLESKLKTACDDVDMKILCQRFIRKNRDKLLEELKNNDDVEMICENSTACK